MNLHLGQTQAGDQQSCHQHLFIIYFIQIKREKYKTDITWFRLSFKFLETTADQTQDFEFYFNVQKVTSHYLATGNRQERAEI